MSRWLSAPALLAWGAAAEVMNFTVYTWPVRLRYGQVYNYPQWDDAKPNYWPKDVIDRYANGSKAMAITGFDVDIVRKQADGTEEQVKLDDHYLHHYILNFGEAKALSQMFNMNKHHTHAAHLVKGCHGMRGEGVQAYRKLLAETGVTDPPAFNTIGFGSAAGAEYRHNPQRFPDPYRVVLWRPEAWAPTLHIINTNRRDNVTNGPGYVSPLLECPCTPQRHFDREHGLIDGKPADPPIQCSAAFARTGNPSCHISTYEGGWRCCENGVFVVDTDKECKTPDCSEKPLDEVVMKFTFYYEDVVDWGVTRPMEPASCCDVTSDIQGDENIEYDVPQCAPGTPPDQCFHVAESVQPLGYFDQYPGAPKGTDLVDLVFAAPHLHWAGISIELIDGLTNKTLCEVHRTPDNSAGVMYGKGSTPGDEDGYLVGLQPCTWAGKAAPRYPRNYPMRARAVYNATTKHTGVMSLWLMQVAAVRSDDVLV